MYCYQLRLAAYFFNWTYQTFKNQEFSLKSVVKPDFSIIIYLINQFSWDLRDLIGTDFQPIAPTKFIK